MKGIKHLALCMAMGSVALNASASQPYAKSTPVQKATAAVTTTELSAAHGYVESTSGQLGYSGIYMPGENRGEDGRPLMNNSLTSWTDSKACAVYYFHHPVATITNIMNISVKKWATAKFRLTITDPDNPSTTIFSKEFSVSGNGNDTEVTIGDVTFPRSSYYRYKLECLSGNGSINRISRFKFQSSASEASYAANYLSSPSVHLNNWHSTSSAAPTGQAYDWAYEEIMIPEESDIIGTYAEAIGALNGYMGIQMNGYDENGAPRHDVLFSMWDDGSTDTDPNLPDHLRAGAIDWDKQTTVNRFGNEGTGVQTYRRGNYWKPGRYVQFITNCRPETTSYTTTENGTTTTHKQQNMLVSTWFNAQDGKGWQYMATVRKRNSSEYFSTWYAFLENYVASSGQALRKAYYRNGYARSRYDKKWYDFNAVGFGHTDGGNSAGARNDWGQGLTSNASDRTFFMTTGGYTSTKQTSMTAPLASDHSTVDTINMTPLEQRIQLAIKNEKIRAAKDEQFAKYKLNKSGWQVISKSTEETSGEGTNGRASQIIDGDDNTYWHPQWNGSIAQLPHTIVVDMKSVQSVGGFEIKQGNDSKRHIKAYDIYGSTDNRNWEKICTDEYAPDNASFRTFTTAEKKIRYFKLVVRSTRATDGPFVRIYEMNVANAEALKTPEIEEPDQFEGKFSFNFEDGRNLPDGSYAEDGWAITQRDDNGKDNVYLLANQNQGADNKFVLPKMKIQAGEKMSIDVCRTNYYYGGDNVYLNVYYSADRKNWTLAKKIKGSELSGTRAVKYTYRFGQPSNFIIENIPAGNYYIAFGAGYTAIDNIKGFEVIDVKHDWMITNSNIPTTAKENYAYNASATLRNIKSTAENAGTYTAKLYVNNQVVSTATAVKLEGKGTQTYNFSYTPRTTGKFDTYIEFKNTTDNYVVKTPTVKVTFEAETNDALVKVGNGSNTLSTSAPIYWLFADNKSSDIEKRGGYTDVLYRPERLAKYGLKAGTKITSIVFRGTATMAKTFKQLVIETQVKTIDAATFKPGEDLKGSDYITVCKYDHRLDADSHKDELFSTTNGGEVVTTITLNKPIVWDGKSAIRVFTHIYGDEYATVKYLLDDDKSDRSCYYRSGTSESFSDVEVPVTYFGINNEPSTLSGKVTYNKVPVMGAKVQLKSSEVSYEETTNAAGEYKIDVSRSDLKYVLTVSAAGYPTYTEANPIEVIDKVVKDIELTNATGINSIFADDNDNSDVQLYNLSGQKVQNTGRGIYIVKGKKYVVK